MHAKEQKRLQGGPGAYFSENFFENLHIYCYIHSNAF